MHFSKSSLLALLPWLMLAPGLAAHAEEARLAVPHSATPAAALRGARAVGRLPAGQTLRLALTLPLRNQTGLAALLKAQYTPGDPQFHRFLTRDQFTAQFGPTEADYQAAMQWAQAQGLTVTGTSATRTLINVSGPASRVEKAFAVNLGQYRLPNGRTAYASPAAASLPFSLAGRVSGVVGLNNIAQRRPSHKVRPSAARRPNAGVGAGTFSGSGPLGFMAPNDVKYAYSLSTITPLYGPASVGGLNGAPYSPTTGTTTTVDPTTGAAATPTLLEGTGQTVGLFELDGFASADTDQYINAFSLPAITAAAAAKATPAGTPSVQTVLIGGYDGKPLSIDGQIEVTLDIDMVLALAPKATIISYEADQVANTTAALDTYQRMANDVANDGTPRLQVISSSWGFPETLSDPADLTAENAIFQQMAAQGQTIYAASGDSGAYDAFRTQDPTVQNMIVADDPATQPYVTGVGGTTLSYKKPGLSAAGVPVPGKYLGEIVWNTGKLNSIGGPVGGGGGSSQIWPKPVYQIGYGTSPNRRDAPDVSLNADSNTGYDLFIGATATTPGTAITVGGTSAAAPLWAGFTALINQQRSSAGLPSLGFVNPQLYPLLSGTAYTSLFHDITVGDNLLYQAQPGYDDASGIGTFIGSALLSRLSFSADAGVGTATVSGTVTDASTGLPIGGALVSATAASGVTRGTATTDTSGAYTLTVPGGISLTVTATVASTTATPTGTTATGTGTTTPPTTGTTAAAGQVYAGQSVAGVTLTSGGTATLNFALSPAHAFPGGLQMISAPFDYTGIGDFAALFGLTTPIAATGPRLIQWQPSQSTYVFYPTAPADTIRLGQGYWVRFTQPSYISLAGTPAPSSQPYTINLTAGWNQIGDPFNSSVSLSGATVSTAAGTSGSSLAASTLVQPIVFSYSTTLNNYVALDATTGTLDPYQGYWIYARQNSLLTLPVPTDLPPPSIPVAGF